MYHAVQWAVYAWRIDTHVMFLLVLMLHVLL